LDTTRFAIEEVIPYVDVPWGSRRFDTGRFGVACAHVSDLSVRLHDRWPRWLPQASAKQDCGLMWPQVLTACLACRRDRWSSCAGPKPPASTRSSVSTSARLRSRRSTGRSWSSTPCSVKACLEMSIAMRLTSSSGRFLLAFRQPNLGMRCRGAVHTRYYFFYRRSGGIQNRLDPESLLGEHVAAAVVKESSAEL